MNTYVSNRVLKINVGFLLAAGPGANHDSVFDVPTLKVAEDLTVNYVRGPIRLSRTAAGILVQGNLETAINGECYRCLDTVTEKRHNSSRRIICLSSLIDIRVQRS